MARVPFFDLLDADIARVLDDALRVVGTLTKRLTDTVLPPTRDITLDGEVYAYHQEMFERNSGRYMIPTRHALQRGGTAKAAP